MKNRVYPYYFTFSALALYIVFVVIPGLSGFYYSFTDWNAYSSEVNFIGWDNIQRIFTSNENYIHSIKNTIFFTISTIILKTIIGFFLALLLSEGVRMKGLHRSLIFMPVIIPMLVIGIIFRSILHPKTGLLNETLRMLKLDFLAQDWLIDFQWAFKSIIAVDTWKGVGFIMVIMLAGIQSISKEYYEAADIDGASYWQQLKFITVPLILPALIVTTVLNLLHGLQVFEIVYVMTNGGPGYTTEVVNTMIFKEFSLGRYSVGSALASILFLIMISLGYFVIRLMTRGNEGVR